MPYIDIMTGEVREDVYLNNGEYMYISSGGIVRRGTVNPGGELYVESGGTAMQITENGGHVSFDFTANVSFKQNSFYNLDVGSATVHSGTTANNTFVSEYGQFSVYSGGIVKNTQVGCDGGLSVYRNGIASNTIIQSGGSLWIECGSAVNILWTPFEGRIVDIEGAYVTFDSSLSGVYYGISGQLLDHSKTMTSQYLGFVRDSEDYGPLYGSMHVMSGGTANGTVASGGHVDVWNGGTANNTTLHASIENVDGDEYPIYGALAVHYGGAANNITINSQCYMDVNPGGKASGITINAGGDLDVDGGKVDGIILNRGGECSVWGGTATVTKWTPCEGDLTIHDEGKVVFTSKYSGVYMGAEDALLSHTKVMTSKYLDNDETMHIMSGGTANNASLYGGELHIWNGGKANDTTLSSYQIYDGENDLTYYRYSDLYVYSGGVASNTILASPYTEIEIRNGGKAIETTIRGGRLEINSGGIASNTTIFQYTHEWNDDEEELWRWDNALFVSSGGVALSTTVGDGGYLYVSSGGIATGIIVKTGGYLRVDSGGMVGSITNLGGTLELADGAMLNYVYKGGDGGKTPASSTTLTVSEDADGGGNKWLYDKKTKEVNDAVTDSEAADITAYTREVLVDAEDVSYEDKHGNLYRNFVGYGDAVDFSKIYLENAAKLSLTVAATDAAKITIWRLNETWKKGILTYSQKSLQTTKLSLDKQTGLYFVNTKPLLLEDGEYYISVESTNAKKGGNAYYNVALNQDRSIFFTRGDMSDDWTDMKWNGDFSDEYRDAGTLSTSTESVIDDDWVGYGDSVDYMRIHLDDAAKLSFSLNASDATKFTIYKLTETVKKGVVIYSLKSLQATTLKKQNGSDEYKATSKALLLKSGDYYVAMKSTNAKKGGYADYNVNINKKETIFYSDADNGWNNWLYDKKSKELNELAYSDAIIISPYTESVQVDDEPLMCEDADGTIWNNYVGYGDEVDFAKIRLESNARLNFTITATDAAKFAVYNVLEKVDPWTGVVSYKLETLQSASLKKAKGDSLYRYSVTMMVPGGMSYFVSIQSTNAKKGGCAYYNVEINQKKSSFEDYYFGAAKDADALSLPETNNLAQDELYAGLNAVQGVSMSETATDFGQNKLLEESGNGLLASL